ncbi:hypothetical protein T01_12324 [Trichinella spiralis]|uniref:Uncharacterized protein n=1 Tax=Trichinella spiralis TaxID=6334 RepID=A0A0V1AX13_TRISP|nr:hypothetical protein T01_12324 [Trichinella spiralis]
MFRFIYLMFCLFVTGTKSNAKKKNCDSVHYVIRSNSIGMKLASVGDLNFFKNVIQKLLPLLNLISKCFGHFPMLSSLSLQLKQSQMKNRQCAEVASFMFTRNWGKINFYFFPLCHLSKYSKTIQQKNKQKLHISFCMLGKPKSAMLLC